MGIKEMASDDVTDLLTKWDSYLVIQDIEKATEIKETINNRLSQLRVEGDMLKEYHILNFRHELHLGHFEKATAQLNQLFSLKGEIDHLFSYYSHLLNGVYAYKEKRFHDAIKHYMEAGKWLPLLQDEIEAADYHYKLASAYYAVRQPLMSVEHAKKAKQIYDKNKDYIRKSAHCKILLGANAVDLHQYEEAEVYYQSAIDDAAKVNDLHLKTVIYYNIGLLYAEQNLSKAAIRYLKYVLEYKEFTPYYLLKSLFLITRENFKIGQVEEAKKWLEQGEVLAEKLKNKEYIMKFRLIKAVYLEEPSEATFIEGIAYFENKALWLDVEEYAEIAARLYVKNQRFEQAVHFYEKAIGARKKLIEMEALK